MKKVGGAISDIYEWITDLPANILTHNTFINSQITKIRKNDSIRNLIHGGVVLSGVKLGSTYQPQINTILSDTSALIGQKVTQLTSPNVISTKEPTDSSIQFTRRDPLLNKEILVHVKENDIPHTASALIDQSKQILYPETELSKNLNWNPDAWVAHKKSKTITKEDTDRYWSKWTTYGVSAYQSMQKKAKKYKLKWAYAKEKYPQHKGYFDWGITGYENEKKKLAE